MNKIQTPEILFKVYYSDGTTFSGTKDNVGDTPMWEGLVIVQRDKNHGRRIVIGGDFYVYENDGWISCDMFTMMQYLARKGMEKRIIVGVMVSQEKWNETVKRAYDDLDFPEKTASYRDEPEYPTGGD